MQTLYKFYNMAYNMLFIQSAEKTTIHYLLFSSSIWNTQWLHFHGAEYFIINHSAHLERLQQSRQFWDHIFNE